MVVMNCGMAVDSSIFRRSRRMFTSTIFRSPLYSGPQTFSSISSRESARPGFSMNSLMMVNSVCVRRTRSPSLSSVRLRGLSTKGPLTMSSSSPSVTPRTRR